MTPQEISEFVNQPIPRRVPHEISRKATNWREPVVWKTLAIALLFFTVISLIPIKNLILPTNSAHWNMMTTQGSIISITPVRFLGIGPVFYSFTTHFSASERNMSTNRFVERNIHTDRLAWRRSDIPGWGIISETKNNPNLKIGETLLLAEPFPVTVEYPRTHPEVALIAEARFSIGIEDKPLVMLSVLGIISTLAIVSIWLVELFMDARRTMHILRNGLFITGYIFIHKDFSTFKKSLSIFSMLKRELARNATILTASFTDQRGRQRESLIKLHSLTAKRNEDWLNDFFLYEYPVSLLYLPNTDYVIVTDLLLDSNPTIGMSRKHDHKMRDMV